MGGEAVAGCQPGIGVADGGALQHGAQAGGGAERGRDVDGLDQLLRLRAVQLGHGQGRADRAPGAMGMDGRAQARAAPMRAPIS